MTYKFRQTPVIAMDKPLIIFEMANNHMGEIANTSAAVLAFARSRLSSRKFFGSPSRCSI